MDKKNESSQTMRIDIHPDSLAENADIRKPKTVFRPDSTTFIARRVRGGDRSPEYEELLQSIYDAVLITDTKGRIVDYNARALDRFRLTEEELSGAKVIDLISGADEDILSAIRANLEDHPSTVIEAYCVRGDRILFPAEIAVNKIHLDYDGQLCFFIRDISIRKQAQEALEDAVARLEEHDRARSQFVSNVSHELRTPLTSMIYAVANMLRGVVGPLPDRVRHYLQILDGDCRRLLGTVNDILDLRKVETKTLTLSRTRIPLARLVKRGMESLRVQANQKSIGLELETGTRRWFVHCDAQKMERVILNVVGNAVKFTPEGGQIFVQVQDDEENVGFIKVSIRDTGIGIPEEALPHVMERYFTVGEQPSGSGLGLAISKEIVELHGGLMTVASPPPGYDKGTVFNVSLPAVEPPTLLIVDDDSSVRDVLAKQVGGQGYNVVMAENGREALAKIRKEKPDLVLLDLALPEMEGSDVILKMKSDKHLMRIPVIVITGAHLGRSRSQILNSFSIPTLLKPWDEADLLDRVEGAFLGVAG